MEAAIAGAIVLALFAPIIVTRALLEIVVWLWPGTRFFRISRWSVGPCVPETGATRRQILDVARFWLVIALLMFLIAVSSVLFMLRPTPGLGLDATVFVVGTGVIAGIYGGVAALIECLWVLIRLLRAPRGEAGESRPADGREEAPVVPRHGPRPDRSLRRRLHRA